jgi:MFS family permease
MSGRTAGIVHRFPDIHGRCALSDFRSVAGTGDSADAYVDPVASPVDRRNARLYLTGLGFSLIGNSAMSLAAGIWVKSLTGSSATAGAVSIGIYAPSLLGPIVGLAVDRVDRRRWLVAVNVASAAVVASLLAVRGRGEVWLIFVVMVGYGFSLVMAGPAEDALFAQMLPTDVRRQVNGWRLGLQEAGRLVAPLVGAGLFAWLGGGAVAGLDAATFVIAALATLRLKVPALPTVVETRHWRADLLAGFWHLRSTPGLGRIVVVGSTIMAVSGIGVAAQYSLVQALGRSPSFLGVLAAGLGAGSIVASLTSGRVLARFGEPGLLVAGLANYAIGSAVRCIPSSVAAVLGSVILGFALPWVFLAILNASQRLTPQHLQGRVSAAVSLVFFGPQTAMLAIGSAAITVLNYRTIYLGSAAVAAALMVIALSTTRTEPDPAASLRQDESDGRWRNGD